MQALGVKFSLPVIGVYSVLFLFDIGELSIGEILATRRIGSRDATKYCALYSMAWSLRYVKVLSLGNVVYIGWRKE